MRRRSGRSPPHVDGLVYAPTPSGPTVLAAAMYLLPSTVSGRRCPTARWCSGTSAPHVCGQPHRLAARRPSTSRGHPALRAGSVPKATPYVTMVWQVPVAGGPLAIQPPDIQIVEAAVMAVP